MQALFLVGGSGTRLRPFTNYLPKPMISIMGRPLLERNIVRLKEFGVDEVVMNPCYLPHKIMGHFKNGEDIGLTVRYVKEDTPLGTGGAIKNTQNYYTDSFFVFNADVLCDISLPGMLAFHKKKKAAVTIAATWVEDPTAYGTICYDEQDNIVEFKEKPRPEEVQSHYINAGVYIFEPHVLEHIPQGREVSVEREIFPSLLEKGMRLAVYRDIGYWMDIGTPEKYVQAHYDIFEGMCDVGETDFERGALCIDPSATIEAHTMMAAPAFVGKNAQVEKYNVVGPHVVLGDDTVVEPNCYLENAIIWPGTHVPAGSFVRNCIVAQVNGKLLEFPYQKLNINTKRAGEKYERRH